MGDVMPPNEYETLFGGAGARFHVPVLLDVANKNDRTYLERMKQTVLDNLSKSVTIQAQALHHTCTMRSENIAKFLAKYVSK